MCTRTPLTIPSSTKIVTDITIHTFFIVSVWFVSLLFLPLYL